MITFLNSRTKRGFHKGGNKHKRRSGRFALGKSAKQIEAIASNKHTFPCATALGNGGETWICLVCLAELLLPEVQDRAPIDELHDEDVGATQLLRGFEGRETGLQDSRTGENPPDQPRILLRSGVPRGPSVSNLFGPQVAGSEWNSPECVTLGDSSPTT